ncbi:MAG: dTDP-glucose 4,6-dehydratase [Parachlamydiales bacterium]|jgi:dTDP-glucose 4,6-dehydratase
MPRKINSLLVTGGLGFIGSAFIRFVLKQKNLQIRVVNFDLMTYAASLESVKKIAKDPRYFFVKGNILDQKKVLEAIDRFAIDACIHFAAETHVDNSIADPKLFLRTNIEGTFELLECLRKRPSLHFHHVSTDEVFGSLENGFFNEDSPYRPNSPYAASKAASDHLVRSYARTYKLSTTLSNCSNNYGPFQNAEKLIPQMLKKALLKQRLPVYGTGENVRDWLFVEDHVAALWQILLWAAPSQTFTIGGGAEKTNLELVRRLLELLAFELKEAPQKYLDLISFVKDRPGHDRRYAIDFSRLRKQLGWQPQVDLAEGLKKTLRWYLANREWLFSQKAPLKQLIKKAAVSDCI